MFSSISDFMLSMFHWLLGIVIFLVVVYDLEYRYHGIKRNRRRNINSSNSNNNSNNSNNSNNAGNILTNSNNTLNHLQFENTIINLINNPEIKNL